MNTRKTAAALAALTLSFGLSACGGSQSVDEACKVADDEVKSAMGDMTSIDVTDADKATDTVKSMSDALKKTEGKLENDEVKTAVGDLAEEFDKFESVFADLKAAGSDTTKLTEVSQEMGQISKDIQAQGKKLNDLCK